jgi:molybdate transport system ATP-binding protein
MLDQPRVPLTVVAALTQGSFALDVSWSGDCRLLGLFGPSGSGKTTLLEVIAGLRRPRLARIAIGDRVLADTSTGAHTHVRDRGIGYAPQDAALFPHLDVRGNIAYGAGRGGGAPLDVLLRMLEIEPLIDRPVQGLSGGERQRVALARALASAPSLLLLDEPLSAVDVPLRRRILEALGAWIGRAGIPAIHVSHDEADLRVAADQIVVMSDGRLVGEA